MKKTLIALAALAAAGATLAQSSVTIYGRMDLGMSQQTTTTPANPAGVDAFSLAGAEGERTGSRLGFRGTEDLGGGLRANFVYEIGINADRGTGAGHGDVQAARNNADTRLANLSLSGGFGTVVVGTFMNAFDTARGFSPATANVPGGDFTQWQLAAGTERFDSRSQNAIAYVSPTFNGFTFAAGTVREDNTVFANNDVSGYILSLGFSQGPFAAQFAFGDSSVSPSAGGADIVDLRNWALGLRYTLPQVVVSFVYEDTRNSRLAAGDFDANAWEIGARFPMGAFAPYVTFGQGEISSRTTLLGAPTSNDTSAWQIGTTYNLSARTWIYAAVGEAQREQTNGINVRKEAGYAIGLVHTF